MRRSRFHFRKCLILSESCVAIILFPETFESMWPQAAQEYAKIYYTYRP